MQPPATLAFPVGVTLTPQSDTVPQRLLVVSSNFNLRYRSGRLHAFDRATLDDEVDRAIAAQCPGGEPACLPVHIADLGSFLVGSVEIGDFGGQVEATILPNGFVRAFVPVRGNHSVVAADLGAERIRCAAGGSDCRELGVSSPGLDPYSLTIAARQVYVGNGTLERDRSGVVGALAIDDPAWERGSGGLTAIELERTAIGGVTSGACRGEGDDETCTVFAVGRALVDGRQLIASFDVRPGIPQFGPIHQRNLFAQSRGTDSRGAALGSDGTTLFFASRFPDALAKVDVGEQPRFPTDGCVVGPDEEPPEDGCPDLPPPSGDGPRFLTMDLSPAPRGPNTVRILPRDAGDLVALTSEESLSLYDGPSGVLVGDLANLGSAPADLAVLDREEGLRLYVTSFGRGTLAVVDIPDPERPEGARLVAILGLAQEAGF